MNPWSFYDRPAAQIPFRLNGYDGTAAVFYGMNDDPRKAGFDMIPGLNFNVDICRGYPLMHARIEKYAASGYRTACAWIQIVTNSRVRSTVQGEMDIEKSVSIDIAPAMSEAGIPFASFGNYPQIFDAPCYNLGSDAELKWVADTFLTTLPMRSKTEEIRWLLGFRWGYIEYENPEENPVVLLPLAVTDPSIWNNHLDFLRNECGGWKFRTEGL
jgi:hypothetical protein